jgi:precorrin-6Y C5,15-methyltransferase (decarboxylating)
MHRIFILGISGRQLPDTHREALASSVLVIGTERFRELASAAGGQFEKITPLSGALLRIEAALPTGNVCVLASGDPLYYGIGRLLLERFPAEQIEILPAVSAVQSGCAALKMAWDDARVVSLHGRTPAHLAGTLLAHHKTVVLTDSSNSPDTLARELVEYLDLVGAPGLLEQITMHVAEDLGMQSQRLRTGSPSSLFTETFSPLNIVVIQRPAGMDRQRHRFGLTEEDIAHSRGLITKNEVRAATLHRLQLPPGGVFWDIGAGSGSISIEAARLNPDLTVYAVEQKREEIQNIKNNIVKFGCFNIVPVHGAAPGVLDSLPSPDRVFVGGSGGELQRIVEHIAKRKSNGPGRVVVNGVIQKTIEQAPLFLRRHGFRVETSTIVVTRENDDGGVLTFNPISIVTGRK